MLNEELAISKLTPISHMATPYTLPLNLELHRARVTAENIAMASHTDDDRRRENAVTRLNICSYELLSLWQQEHIPTDTLIPDEVSKILWLAEEAYLSMPIEDLEQHLYNLTHVVEDITARYGIEEIDTDYIARYVPEKVREALLRVIDQTTIQAQITYSYLDRIEQLAELLPYPNDDGNRKRPMMELVTYATGYQDEAGKLVRHPHLAYEPVVQELSENREFQTLVNTYLRETYGVNYNLKTGRVSPTDHANSLTDDHQR